MPAGAPLLLRSDRPGGWRAHAARDFRRLALVALVLRLLVAPWFAHSGDMTTFIAWGLKLADTGPAQFWSGKYWCDYLPGYLHVLRMLGEIARFVPKPAHMLLFKLPNIFADLASAWIIWRVTRDKVGAYHLWLPFTYLANPAVWINSTLWGQADSFHALCLIGGLYLLTRRKVLTAAVVFGYALAVKPHSLVLLPVAAVYLLRQRTLWIRMAIGAALIPVVFAATFLPFTGWSIGELIPFIQARIAATMGQYGHASVNALNLWYLLGFNWVKDSELLVGRLTIRDVAYVLCGLGLGLVLLRYWLKGRDATSGPWEAAALAYLVVFLFVTRAHERHVFPYFGLLTVALAWRKVAMIPQVLLSATYCINLLLAWNYLLSPTRGMALCAPPLGIALCALNLVALPLTVIALQRVGLRWFAWFRRRAPAVPTAPAPLASAPWAERHWRVALAAIVLFALATRAARLNAPPERYFDEVYHAYTAEQWVKGNTDAWLWSTKSPDKGCSYEWTHPPLAKLLMADAMRIFGIHPWAWRLPGVILGALSVLLIFGIAQKLLANRGVALLSAAFAALDLLPLFASRIGMNDVYCVTFILLAVWLGLQNRWDRLAPLAVGVALACKWTALYALPLMGFVHLIRAIEHSLHAAPTDHSTFRRSGGWSGTAEKTSGDRNDLQAPISIVRANAGRLTVLAVLYVLLVPAIYLGSYIPFFRAGHSWADFKELQVQMWSYHTGLKATHAYSSPAWQWPLLSKAVWCFTKRVETPIGNAEVSSPTPSTSTSDRVRVRQANQSRARKEAETGLPAREMATTGQATAILANSNGSAAQPAITSPNSRVANIRVANIYAWGNPIIWCAGLGAMLFAVYHVTARRDPAVVILLAGYLAFWFPWLMSPRIMFLYHYLPSLPFLYITLAWSLFRTGFSARAIQVTLLLTAAAFMLIYPYVTAVYLPLRLSPTAW